MIISCPRVAIGAYLYGNDSIINIPHIIKMKTQYMKKNNLLLKDLLCIPTDYDTSVTLTQ